MYILSVTDASTTATAGGFTRFPLFSYNISLTPKKVSITYLGLYLTHLLRSVKKIAILKPSNQLNIQVVPNKSLQN